MKNHSPQIYRSTSFFSRLLISKRTKFCSYIVDPNRSNAWPWKHLQIETGSSSFENLREKSFFKHSSWPRNIVVDKLIIRSGRLHLCHNFFAIEETSIVPRTQNCIPMHGFGHTHNSSINFYTTKTIDVLNALRCFIVVSVAADRKSYWPPMQNVELQDELEFDFHVNRRRENSFLCATAWKQNAQLNKLSLWWPRRYRNSEQMFAEQQNGSCATMHFVSQAHRSWFLLQIFLGALFELVEHWNVYILRISLDG